MEHIFPELSYPFDALEPFIDARTMEVHFTKHHQAYITKLNAAPKGYGQLAALSVEHLNCFHRKPRRPFNLRQKAVVWY
jgi:superoxide dismutase, Fe-Mn family